MSKRKLNNKYKKLGAGGLWFQIGERLTAGRKNSNMHLNLSSMQKKLLLG